MARVEVLGSDTPKGDDYRVPVEIWDGRAWRDKDVKVNEALVLLRM